MVQKIYIRRGLQSELDNIILEEGELGWTTDTKMLYAGDDTTSGGLLVSASGLGIVSLNGLMGVVTVSGHSGIEVLTIGQTIVVSGTVIEYVKSLNTLADDVTISGKGSVAVTTDGQNVVVSGVVYPDMFTELYDTPDAYTGQANKLVGVNSGESGVEFTKVFKVQSTLSDHDYSGLIADGIAGETLSFGTHVVLDTDSKWKKTDATLEDRTNGHIGVVLTSGILNDTVQLLLNGYVRDDSWSFTVGGSVYISTTVSGGLTSTEPTTSGEFVRVVGHSRSTSILWYSPDNTFIKLRI